MEDKCKFIGPDDDISELAGSVIMNLVEDGFSMTDYDRAWRESVDDRLQRIEINAAENNDMLIRIIGILDRGVDVRPAVVKVKVERPAIHFDGFWNVYPKKVGKSQCLEMWRKRSLDNISLIIIDDVLNRIKNCAKWKGGYILDPIRYLRDKRWQDEIQKESSVPVDVPKELNALVRYAAKSGLEAKVGEPLHEFRARVVREVAGSDE